MGKSIGDGELATNDAARSKTSDANGHDRSTSAMGTRTGSESANTRSTKNGRSNIKIIRRMTKRNGRIR